MNTQLPTTESFFSLFRPSLKFESTNPTVDPPDDTGGTDTTPPPPPPPDEEEPPQ